MRRIAFLAVAATMLAQSSARAQVVQYDSLNTAAQAGYSEVNTNTPVYGDALTLSSGGPLQTIGFALFNSTSGGNTGAILTGTMNIKLYDNTTPYAGGVLADPLIASVNVNLDFSASGGLAAGFFTRVTSDFSSLNITLPQNIFMTQQFTELTGASLRNGTVVDANSAVGSSPANVYIKSTATAEGLYTFTGTANQFAFLISTVPEPGSLALCGLALAGIPAWLRRRRTA